MSTTQKVIRIQTTVHQDGEIHIKDPSLQSGDDVEVIVLLPVIDKRQSAVEILARLPGHRLYESADEVDKYLAGERDSWDR